MELSVNVAAYLPYTQFLLPVMDRNTSSPSPAHWLPPRSPLLWEALALCNISLVLVSLGWVDRRAIALWPWRNVSAGLRGDRGVWQSPTCRDHSSISPLVDRDTGVSTLATVPPACGFCYKGVRAICGWRTCRTDSAIGRRFLQTTSFETVLFCSSRLALSQDFLGRLVQSVS